MPSLKAMKSFLRSEGLRLNYYKYYGGLAWRDKIGGTYTDPEDIQKLYKRVLKRKYNRDNKRLYAAYFVCVGKNQWTRMAFKTTFDSVHEHQILTRDEALASLGGTFGKNP